MSSCGSASCDASGSLAKRRLPFLFGKGLDLPPHCERPQYLRQGQVLPLPRTVQASGERPTTGFCNCAEEYISPRTKALHRAYFVSMNQVLFFRLTRNSLRKVLLFPIIIESPKNCNMVTIFYDRLHDFPSVFSDDVPRKKTVSLSSVQHSPEQYRKAN